jgi:hypothetical protein
VPVGQYALGNYYYSTLPFVILVSVPSQVFGLAPKKKNSYSHGKMKKIAKIYGLIFSMRFGVNGGWVEKS